MRILSSTLFIASVAALIKGFHKMLAYSNPEGLYSESVNAYVGGDAHNFTISGTHATAYFVLFGSLLIAGLLVEVLKVILPVDEEEMALRKQLQEELENE